MSRHIPGHSAAASNGASLLNSRFALLVLPLAGAGMVSGCTGMGVFFDHTTKWFDENPNSPVGSSENFDEIRGQTVEVPPLLPEKGNVWPDNSGPDQTLQDLEKQQATEIRRGAVQTGSTPPFGSNPQVNRANGADRGLPPPNVPTGQPPANLGTQTQPTPNGPAISTTGGDRTQGYRGLGNGGPGAGRNNSGGGPSPGSVLVPNGNGTSTLIGPDGSVQTVPTKP